MEKKEPERKKLTLNETLNALLDPLGATLKLCRIGPSSLTKHQN